MIKTDSIPSVYGLFKNKKYFTQRSLTTWNSTSHVNGAVIWMANEQVHNALWKILKDGSNSGHVVLSMDRKKSNQICHGIFPPFLGWARNWDTHWLWNKLSNRHGRKLQVKAWIRRRSSFKSTIATFARSTKPTSYKHCSDFGDDYPRCHLYCLGFYMMRVDQCKCVPSGAAWELPKLFPATTVLDFPWHVDLHSRWKGSRCAQTYLQIFVRVEKLWHWFQDLILWVWSRFSLVLMILLILGFAFRVGNYLQRHIRTKGIRRVL